jgi:hypothetical protein
MRTQLFSAGLAAAALVMILPLAAGAGPRSGGHDGKRLLYATDASGNLLRFSANKPGDADSLALTGLPAGVSLDGIDFRPATGDLYGLGSDRVVYRVSPWTAIAIAEGAADPSLAGALAGDRLGFDFNPTVDKIRVTSDADDNLRVDPDPGTLLANDVDLNPAGVTVVGSAYTNSSFSAAKPATTMLLAYDVASSPDQVLLQAPPNNGTLTMPRPVDVDLGVDVGFDIAGSENWGYVAGTPEGKSGARLYRVDVTTGKTRSLGRISDDPVTITGLAAVQDGAPWAGRKGGWDDDDD